MAFQSAMERYPEVLTIKDVMDILRIGRSTVYAMVQRKELKAIRLSNGIIRVLKSEFIKDVEKHIVT